MTFEIKVSLVKARVLVSPDPARVRVGDKVVWAFDSERLRWTVYFHCGSPFVKEHGYPDQFQASATDSKLGPFVTEDPGDYKYGVRVEDAVTGHTLGDDDPHLVVQRPDEQ